MLVDVGVVETLILGTPMDEHTLNKIVIAYGAVLSQNDIHEIVERKTGEELEHKKVRRHCESLRLLLT